jgi:hypothetical protein
LQQNEAARDYAQTILEEAPPEALILANWHWATPLWYLQTVENRRPDVTVEYVAPAEGPYSQTWVEAIDTAWADGRSVIATYIDETAYAALPPAEPIGEALLFRQTARTQLPDEFAPLALRLGTAQILGYWLDQEAVEIGQETALTIAWQGTETTSFFVHLLDETGSIVAQADIQTVPQAEAITLTQFRLTPRQGPGSYTLRLGSGDSFSEIGPLPVTLALLPPATQNPVYRPVHEAASTQKLIGYDWDTTLPGQSRLYLHWQNNEGYWNSIHDNITSVDLANALPVTLGLASLRRHGLYSGSVSSIVTSPPWFQPV